VWIRPKEQVFINRHSGKQMTRGRYKPHPKSCDSFGWESGDIFILEDHFPRRRREQTTHCLEQRGLPGTVRADDHYRLAPVYMKGHIVDDIIALVSGRETVDLKHI
jgi:hypothetical protein